MYIYIFICVCIYTCASILSILILIGFWQIQKKHANFPFFPRFPHVFPIFRAHRGTSEAACREFFDALEALDLVEAPTAAGQRYFGRFARWALREFLGEAKGTLELAKNVPGAVELW